MRRSAAVTHAAFAAFGAFWGAWAAVLPAIQQQTHASKATLGLALVGFAVGSVPTMLLAGRAVDRFGGGAVAAMCAAFAAGAALPGLAHSTLALAAALVAAGAGSGAFDVAVNARASRLEHTTGARVLIAAHAFYAAGVVVGAVAAGLARSAGASPEDVLAVAALALVGVALALALDRVAPARDTSARLRLRRALLLLGVVGAACAIVESGLESWSALFLERTFDARPAISGLAPGLFGGAMALGRFSGHALGRLTGDLALFSGGLLLTAAGLALAAAAPGIPVALAGFAVGGAGISLTAPLLFRAAGRAGGGSGGAIATMTTLTYSGFVLGPPLVGGIAQLGGLRASFAALAGAAAVVAVAAPRVHLLR